MNRLPLILSLLFALTTPCALAESESMQIPPAPADGPQVEYPELWQLDWSVRSQLPEFSVAGWLASEESARRFARIDGEVYVEGDTLENGLTLLEVHRNALVFVFQGQTFRYNPR